MENEKLLEVLKEMKNSKDSEFTSSVSKLTKNVASIILDECSNEPIEYTKVIMEYGCASGCVGALTYYVDTEKFFKDNCNDILELFGDRINEFGSLVDELNSNNLAWFGFEETLKDIMSKLDIDFTRKNNDRFTKYCKIIDTLMNIDENLHYDELLYQCGFDLDCAYDLLYDSLQITIEELKGENKNIKPYVEILNLISLEQ